MGAVVFIREHAPYSVPMTDGVDLWFRMYACLRWTLYVDHDLTEEPEEEDEKGEALLEGMDGVSCSVHCAHDMHGIRTTTDFGFRCTLLLYLAVCEGLRGFAAQFVLV